MLAFSYSDKIHEKIILKGGNACFGIRFQKFQSMGSLFCGIWAYDKISCGEGCGRGKAAPLKVTQKHREIGRGQNQNIFFNDTLSATSFPFTRAHFLKILPFSNSLISWDHNFNTRPSGGHLRHKP